MRMHYLVTSDTATVRPPHKRDKTLYKQVYHQQIALIPEYKSEQFVGDKLVYIISCTEDVQC